MINFKDLSMWLTQISLTVFRRLTQSSKVHWGLKAGWKLVETLSIQNKCQISLWVLLFDAWYLVEKFSTFVLFIGLSLSFLILYFQSFSHIYYIDCFSVYILRPAFRLKALLYSLFSWGFSPLTMTSLTYPQTRLLLKDFYSLLHSQGFSHL